MKLWPEVFLSLGLRASSLQKGLVCSLLSKATEGQPSTDGLLENDSSNILKDDRSIRLRKGAIKREKKVIQPSESGAHERLQCDPVIILPFVLHLSFMVATAFFVMHVQVATRFLSASPLLYWFASHIMRSPGIGRRWGYLIWAYCGAYIFLGSLLFSNFYPFT